MPSIYVTDTLQELAAQANQAVGAPKTMRNQDGPKRQNYNTGHLLVRRGRWGFTFYRVGDFTGGLNAVFNATTKEGMAVMIRAFIVGAEANQHPTITGGPAKAINYSEGKE